MACIEMVIHRRLKSRYWALGEPGRTKFSVSGLEVMSVMLRANRRLAAGEGALAVAVAFFLCPPQQPALHHRP